MKRILKVLLVSIFMFTVSVNIWAEDKVKIDFSVEVKDKNNADIFINIKNAKNLYAASVDFIYDPKEIKVKSIEGGELVKKNQEKIIELGGETEKDGNKANYQFTFLGKVQGLSDSGSICKIEVEYLKDNSISISYENINVQLAKISDDYNISEMKYSTNNESSESSSGSKDKDPITEEVNGTSNKNNQEKTNSSNEIDSNKNNHENITIISDNDDEYKNEEADENGTSSIDSDLNKEEKYDDDNNVVLFAIGGTIIVAILVLLIVLKKKNKRVKKTDEEK